MTVEKQRPNRVLHCIRQAVSNLETRKVPDQELLQHFEARRDETAFATLVRRHGPMVLRVALRTLQNEHDAEDVFQATFLVLSRKAQTIRRQESLGSWLYGVAYRLALTTKATIGQRRNRERRASEKAAATPLAQITVQEAQGILDEELNRLPEKFRAPVVLCCLEGLSRDEAAHQIGCPVSVLKSRLEQARERLRERCVVRGLTLPCGLTAMLLLDGVVEATVPPILIGFTIKAAMTIAAHGEVIVSANVTALLEGTTKGMLAVKTKTLAVFVATLGILVVGFGIGTHLDEASGQPDAKQQGVLEPVAAGQDTAEAKDNVQARTDHYGDPLPPGAIARIGTTRWWHGRSQQGCALIYAPDGKSLYACDGGNVVRMLDALTGKEVQRIEKKDAEISSFALAPDGKTLVTAGLRSPFLRVWDVSTGKELRQIPSDQNGTFDVAFSPDGTTFAAATVNVILLWELPAWKEKRRLAAEAVCSVVFLRDGKTLISAQGGRFAAIQWWDVGTGEQLRIRRDKLDHHRRLTVSPDGKRLAFVSEPSTLELWDAATAAEISQTVLTKQPDWGVWSLCFSADSQTLACGNGVGRPGNQTLFFAAATGKELRRWHDDSYTATLAYSPDGKTLARAGSGVIRVCDAVTGKPETPSMFGLPSYAMSLAFAPNAESLLVSCFGGHTGQWNPRTGKQLAPLQPPPNGFSGPAGMLLGVALTADGNKAALVDGKGVLHVWEPPTGKLLTRIGNPPVATDQADFSLDGKLLVVKHQDEVIRIWETTSGKLRCALPVFGKHRLPHPHAFSPDGRILATAPSSLDDSVIRLWETASGKPLGQLAWQDNSSSDRLVFSADGKFLVSAHGGRLSKGDNAEIDVRLWDVTTKRVLRKYKVPIDDMWSLVLSPDNKTLAAAVHDTIHLWEVATGRERGRMPGHRGTIRSLSFSPDGRLLASGSVDYTALVWDVTGVSPDGTWSLRDTPPDEIERLWSDLNGADGVRAYRAVWRMAVAARQSVPFLAKRLVPVRNVEEARLTRLTAELDAVQFEVRNQAYRKLQQLGDIAGPALRKALGGQSSLEARRRLEMLLDQVDSRTLTAEQLPVFRAIEVLEHAGTAEAIQVLKHLAGGAPAARITQEATAILERIKAVATR